MEPVDEIHPSFSRLMDAARPHGDTRATDLVKRLGVSPQTVTNWKKRGVSEEGARKAQRAYGCDVNTILGTELGIAFSHRIASPVSPYDATLTHPSPARYQRVQVRGAAMVGEDGFWEDLEDAGNAYVEWRTRHGDEYAIEIKSDRFHPEIRRGALVIFSPSKALAFNEYALVKLRDGRSTILEFLRQDGDLYTFTALQSGGRRVSLEAAQIEHVHAYAGTAPASDKQMA